MPLKDALLALMVVVIWGTNFVVVDEGLDRVPALLFVAMRFVVVLLPAVFFVPRPAARWQDVAMLGLFMSFAQFGLLYLALALDMPPGLASLVLQAQVLFTVVIATLTIGERPTRRQVVAVLIGAAGLSVVAVGRSAATPLVALLLTLAAALSWAIGNVLSRRVRAASGLSLTVWSGLVVPAPMFLLSLLVDGPHEVFHALAHLPISALWATAYTAYLASLVGYGTWNLLLGRHPAAAVVPFALLVPVVGMLTAWVVQGETPNAAESVGGVLLLVGVAATTLRTKRRAQRPEQA